MFQGRDERARRASRFLAVTGAKYEFETRLAIGVRARLKGPPARRGSSPPAARLAAHH